MFHRADHFKIYVECRNELIRTCARRAQEVADKYGEPLLRAMGFLGKQSIEEGVRKELVAFEEDRERKVFAKVDFRQIRVLEDFRQHFENRIQSAIHLITEPSLEDHNLPRRPAPFVVDTAMRKRRGYRNRETKRGRRSN